MKTRYSISVIIPLIAALAAATSSFLGIGGCEKSVESKQQAMVERQIRFRGISDENILRVMREVPRVEFVAPEYKKIAYDDIRAPIGDGQTLDRPYEDALILDTLKLKSTDRVLEVGTGSGYLASLMSKLAKDVYTIEIVPVLGEKARKKLESLGFKNVTVRVGDGYLGWEEHAPFDAIVLTASPSKIPEPLKKQLKEGGRILLPLGGEERFQELLLYVKENGKMVLRQRVAPLSFVPMKGLSEEK
jgi:protein-L-isoaspartate(D-aspartate) O-methyltransferase